jgi:hypothetical protein
MKRYRITCVLDVRYTIEEYLGWQMLVGESRQTTDDEIERLLRQRGRSVTARALLNYLEGYHAVAEGRLPGDPPQRYGPYVPRAKALP